MRKVENLTKAFEVVFKIIGQYKYDKQSSERAGYAIYRSTTNHLEYACNLGNRIEINTKDGKSENIWIDENIAKITRLNQKILEQSGEIAKLKMRIRELEVKSNLAEIKDTKKVINSVGVESWIEAGINVVKVGDKLIDNTDSFSRLDYYAKHGNGIELVRREDDLIIGRAGEVTLKNGDKIYYNIRQV